MKRMLTVLLLALATISAQAHGYGHHHGGYRGGWGYGWVAPTVIGGVIAYEVARPPVVVQPPPQPQRMGFYCPTAQLFYPTVQSCPVPWQQVPY